MTDHHVAPQGWIELEIGEGADPSDQGIVECRDANTIYTAGWSYGNHPAAMAWRVYFGVRNAELLLLGSG